MYECVFLYTQYYRHRFPNHTNTYTNIHTHIHKQINKYRNIDSHSHTHELIQSTGTQITQIHIQKHADTYKHLIYTHKHTYRYINLKTLTHKHSHIQTHTYIREH